MLTDLTVFAVSYARYRKWMDAGRCIALDNDEETEKLITDNYGLLRKLAKSVEYQYILDLNYTRFTFSEI
ncbi:MAG: hypothetical protein IJH62_02020 [Mogibacterium sp.]|nr:hypothetical protein [Mogibacterium sp.]